MPGYPDRNCSVPLMPPQESGRAARGDGVGGAVRQGDDAGGGDRAAVSALRPVEDEPVLPARDGRGRVVQGRARIGSPGLPSGSGTGGVWMMPVAAILFTPATGIGLVGRGRW